MLFFLIVLTFVQLLLAYIFCRIWLRNRKEENSICILVLGDIGRSPRMQYHAISFAKEKFAVHLIGYPGSTPLQRFSEFPNVKIDYLTPPPDLQNKVTRLFSYVIKVIWQSVNLLAILLGKCHSSHLMLQNPPAIPTIPICWLFCILSNAKFVIDWHNYAYSIMALNLSHTHILVKFAKFIESYFGKKADYNFCVTKSMKNDLKIKWGIEANVLYDRPAERFRPITIEEKHALFLILGEDYKIFQGENDTCTLFTETLSNGEIQMRSDRPALLVSSTSWTEDEDFSILLSALDDYEAACVENDLHLPKLICVITGKGPLKDFYIALIERRNWKNVTVITPWLENEDYPKILGSADLGVCLHTSSSGLDLPMKVVDMFGCGLPVLAFNFQSLHELVQHDENSLIFSNEKELSYELKMWFKNFPNDMEQKAKSSKFKQELEKFRLIGWHGNWSVTALPCFKQ
ncbi:chitobiosyldiphosphodolichol beta-mannosyltransferase [Leptopilina boulardi]|uniref:chitobiosyldiphosphodolichol beta-mannosyltransferase n=1 Tax=Leptopilina boulardi TaxID=63433 RepID=UPI0021F68B77|nr:chitobiosyldiphosphodolichol beta-mannosyltransferase [Leptopilina boulardi]